MTPELIRQLHDRHTRGEMLSPQDLETLQQWYAAEDRAETDELQRRGDTTNLDQLRDSIRVVSARLADTASQIRDLTAINEQLRREIDSYRRQLVARLPVHLA